MEKPILGGNIKEDSLLVRMTELVVGWLKRVYDWSRRNKDSQNQN